MAKRNEQPKVDVVIDETMPALSTIVAEAEAEAGNTVTLEQVEDDSIREILTYLSDTENHKHFAAMNNNSATSDVYKLVYSLVLGGEILEGFDYSKAVKESEDAFLADTTRNPDIFPGFGGDNQIAVCIDNLKKVDKMVRIAREIHPDVTSPKTGKLVKSPKAKSAENVVNYARKVAEYLLTGGKSDTFTGNMFRPGTITVEFGEMSQAYVGISGLLHLWNAPSSTRSVLKALPKDETPKGNTVTFEDGEAEKIEAWMNTKVGQSKSNVEGWTTVEDVKSQATDAELGTILRDGGVIVEARKKDAFDKAEREAFENAARYLASLDADKARELLELAKKYRDERAE